MKSSWYILKNCFLDTKYLKFLASVMHFTENLSNFLFSAVTTQTVYLYFLNITLKTFAPSSVPDMLFYGTMTIALLITFF